MTEERNASVPPPWERIPSDQVVGYAIRARVGDGGSLSSIAATIDQGGNEWHTTMVGPTGVQAVLVHYSTPLGEVFAEAEQALRELGWNLAAITSERASN